MIRELRKKIAGMTMATMVFVLTVILLLGCCAAYKTCEHMIDLVLQDVANGIADDALIEVGEEFFPNGIFWGREELLEVGNMPIHTVMLDQSGTVLEMNCLTGGSALEKNVLADILQDAGKNTHGTWKEFQYFKTENEAGFTVVIAERSNHLWHRLRAQMLRQSVTGALPIYLLLALASWLFAGVAVRPAKEALKKQQRFLADAGHELKTPLAAISINAAALEEDFGRSPYLDSIRYESSRMSGLVRKLIEVACMEDPEKVVLTQLDLTSLLEQASLSYESMALEKHVQYEIQLQDDVQILSDGERLRQIAAILLDNAFKYVDENGKVKITLNSQGGRTIMTVGNSGQGIPKEEKPYIFERFYRVDKSRSDQGSYGLGLSIAGKLAQELKGKITVESEPGVWTEFSMSL